MRAQGECGRRTFKLTLEHAARKVECEAKLEDARRASEAFESLGMAPDPARARAR